MALSGTIDEWKQDEKGRWSRTGHPEDGVITLTEGVTFADLWAKRLQDDEAETAKVGRLSAFLADASRQEFLTALRSASPDQIDTYISNRLRSADVVDLASAKAFCRRTEVAIASILKVIAILADR